MPGCTSVQPGILSLLLLEKFVSNKTNGKNKKGSQDLSALNQPWISMRSGMILVAIASVAMAVLTAWQAIPQLGWLEGSLWGLLFGGLIWVIFFGNLWINKLLRRR